MNFCLGSRRNSNLMDRKESDRKENVMRKATISCHFRFIGFDSIKFSTSISMIESRTSPLSRQSCFVITIRLPHNRLSLFPVLHCDYEDILATSNLSLMTLTATDVWLALFSFLFLCAHESGCLIKMKVSLLQTA